MNRVSRRSAAEAAEALLEAGRTEPVLDYDVELGLARHHDWVRNQAPVPEWAQAGVATATKSFATMVIKTIVSTVLVGALATAAWQARELLQPSAAIGGAASQPGAVATQPAVPDARATEAEAKVAPIPIPVPVQSMPTEHAARRVGRVEVPDKRSARMHRTHKEARASGARTESSPVAEGSAPEALSDSAAAPGANRTDVTAARAATEPTPASAVAVTERKSLKTEPKPPPAQERKAQQPDDLLEMQQVATAEQLLERSPARALALVRQGDQHFANGYFQQERAYIAIMALIKLGRVDEARTRAASFARTFPALPYGARIRSALDAASRDSKP